MTPYQILTEAVSADPHKGFRDVWLDFELWERGRGFADDPSAPSKEALDWIRDLDELFVRLDQFSGSDIERCRDALETAFVAFARLDHTEELCEAVRKWRDWRLAEAQAG